ncbi:hypothetical protein [Chamaesiphon sp. GL140_3_metabinner_50]|nr:hypothetical protein [Chamaesiphon sp. GL140_3_metabinner_50]
MIYLINMMDFDDRTAVHHSLSVDRANQSSDNIMGEFPEIT